MNDEATRLEELRARLNQRDVNLPPVRRSPLSPPAKVGDVDWSEPPAAHSGWFSAKRILLFSALFFLAMLGVTGFMFYSGGNVVSTGNIDLTITGPHEVRAGEAVPVEIKVSNHNQQPLQIAELILEYPPGTAGVTDRQRVSLGEVAGGDTVKQTIQPIFFGEKDSTLVMKATLEYRLADSNAIFSKQSGYEVAVSAAPLTVKAALPSQANSGQTVTLQVEVMANTPNPVPGQTVVVNYPAGFRFIKATPAPSNDDNQWAVSDLSPTNKFTIAIDGVIEGQNDEVKNFKVSVGQLAAPASDRLAVVYGATAAELTVQKRQLQLEALINGLTGAEVVANSRSTIQLDINWGNNLNEEVVDGQVSAVFTGATLDESSVRAAGGFYQSTTNTAVWNKTTEPGLARLAPGATETNNLNFTTIGLGNVASQFKNPTIEVDLKFRAKRVSDGDWLESVVHKVIKLNSQLQFATKAVYYDNPLTNLGPMPPKVGTETTYTLTWTLLNSSNDLEQVEVRAPVPPYMSWAGIIVPSGEPLEYVPSDTGGGTLIWHVGYLKAGVGLATAPREVNFKLGLTPSVSQVGSSPALLGPTTVTARDTFTKSSINLTPRQNITTDLTADPRFHYGQGQVVN